jgi:cytochrome c556
MHGGPFHVMKRIALLLLFLSLPAFAAAERRPSTDQAADVVKYRQSVMKAMGSHMKALSLIAAKQVSARSQLAGHAEAVHAMSVGLTDFFPPTTAPDKVHSEAKAAIWQRWREFEAAAKSLERESAQLAAAAKGKDEKKLAAALDATNQACGSCHKAFREEHD